MDVTPLIPQGRKVIEAYGGNGFQVSGDSYPHSIQVFADDVLPWDIVTIHDLTEDHFKAVITAEPKIELILLGCGEKMSPIPSAIRQFLKLHAITIDAMDTGAACRTYNVLLSEGRRVAAALIAL